MKKILLRILLIIIAGYVIICGILYLSQESLIFHPQKLVQEYTFYFPQKFEELKIKTKDNKLMSALLFKSDSSKGVVFYLHGNAGSLQSWGIEAKNYTALNYDVFMPDYRGYGKSEGEINGEDQFFQDIQTAYDRVKTKYAENKIVVLGYSIGTAGAARISSSNHPRLLILQAPYYNLTDMMRHEYPLIPPFILKYKFKTNEYLKKCSMPVVIFHGDADEVIYYGSSLKLKETFKKDETLITLPGQKHNLMSRNPDYLTALEKILPQ